jgi:bis(5'-nucleosyl)-tetraphosphatase (symmetrical)
MATYIVGDIQGCLSGLLRLLKEVNFSPANDRLIAVGDLVGRGPEALETLTYLMSLKDSFDTVLGNHDLHLLAIYCGVRVAKPNDKFDSLLAAANLDTFIHWLRQKPLALLVNQDTLITHAGLYPKWSIKKALACASQVSEQLSGHNWSQFLSIMYGDQPDLWTKALTDQDKMRFTVNALTRMRFVDRQCRLEFGYKGAPKDTVSDLLPWFKVNNDNLKPRQRIIFGHWASLNGKTYDPRFIGLDTGYIWGQNMSLLNIDNDQVYSVRYQEC